MTWKQIDRTKRVQKNGVYTSWKQQIADDCYNQCVYCSIGENPWGGIDHYHIDHYRPQSKFNALKNIITNLYYSCPICNKFKSNHWPNEPTSLDIICYPDPSDHNYSDLFDIDEIKHTLEGKYVSSKFLINRMYLNRPQLIYERREHFLKQKAKRAIDEALELSKQCEDFELIKQINSLLANMLKLTLSRDKISPYKLVDIKKPKKNKSPKTKKS
jgi:hypothetical protein